MGASLGADLAWYGLGQWRGARTLRMLARVSPSAGILVHRARHLFGAHGGAFQLGARFVPELNAISAGLAGATNSSIVRFAFYGLASALIWAGGWISLGYFLSNAVTETAARLGVRLIVFFLAPFALYLLFHRARRHRVIRLFRRARMSPDDLSVVLEKADRMAMPDPPSVERGTSSQADAPSASTRSDAVVLAQRTEARNALAAMRSAVPSPSVKRR